MDTQVETQAKVRERNARIVQWIDDGHVKMATDTVDAFTRLMMRETSFSRLILQPITITNDQLDRAVSIETPIKIVDKEVDNPPAMSVGFGSLPDNLYIYGNKYQVLFDRILSPRFSKDLDTLRTYQMDLRQVVSDNALKDMMAEEDAKFLRAVNLLLGSINTNQPLSNVPQYVSTSGGISRDTVVESKKVLNKTPGLLEPELALVNFVTWKEFEKWGRDEMGGDLSEEIVKNGMMRGELLKLKFLVTIKRNLVPDYAQYMFAPSKFLGKSFMLEEATMHIKKEAFMVDWFFYQSMGVSIGNTYAVARNDYN